LYKKLLEEVVRLEVRRVRRREEIQEPELLMELLTQKYTERSLTHCPICGRAAEEHEIYECCAPYYYVCGEFLFAYAPCCEWDVWYILPRKMVDKIHEINRELSELETFEEFVERIRAYWKMV